MGELCELRVRNGGGDRHLLQGAMVGFSIDAIGCGMGWIIVLKMLKSSKYLGDL